MRKTTYHQLHVFFSASSSKLNRRKPLYLSIIKSIQGLGAKITYNWVLDKEKLQPKELFERAIEGIKRSDLLVAEITYPSIGVGQQITLALSWKIPVLALYQKNTPKTSRFALGMKSPFLTVRQYRIDQLEEILKKNFAIMLRSRFVRFNFISTKEISDYLETESASLKISKSQLLRQIVRSWMANHKP